MNIVSLLLGGLVVASKAQSTRDIFVNASNIVGTLKNLQGKPEAFGHENLEMNLMAGQVLIVPIVVGNYTLSYIQPWD